MSDQYITLIAAVAVPVVGGLVTAAGVWGGEWRQRRNQDYLRSRALDDATGRMTIVETWAKALLEVQGLPDEHTEARTKAISALDDAYRRAVKALDTFPAPKKPLWGLRQVFLLDVSAGGAKMARAIYYLSLAWLLFDAAILTGFVKKDPTASGIIVALVALFLFAVAPALALHALAIAIDSKRSSRQRINTPIHQHPGPAVRSAGQGSAAPSMYPAYGVASPPYPQPPPYPHPPPVAPPWGAPGSTPPAGPSR